MAKITRKNHKIFCDTAASGKIAVFGSLAAGSAAFSLDPDAIQSAEYLSGLGASILLDLAPFKQDMNALQFLLTRQIAYKLQSGIPEYSAGATYYTGNIVNDGTVGIYYSLADGNIGNALTDVTKWAALSVKTASTAAYVSAGVYACNCQNCLSWRSYTTDSQNGSRTFNITNLRDGQRAAISVVTTSGNADTVDVSLEAGLTLVKGGSGYNSLGAKDPVGAALGVLNLTRIGTKVVYSLTKLYYA